MPGKSDGVDDGERSADDELSKGEEKCSAVLTLGWLDASMQTLEIIDSFFIHLVCA